MGLPGYTVGTTSATATGTADRYVLMVAGQNFSGRADVRLGPVQLSLQGPGGQSTMRFTVERAGQSSIAPFWGRQPVHFYDTLSDLGFRGFITHTSARRVPGRSRQVIEVDVAGYDKLLDERIIVNFKTRPDTTQGVVSRKRKFAKDDELVKAILSVENVGLGSLFADAFVDQTNTDMDDMHFKNVTVREALQMIADIAQLPSQYETRRFYVDHSGSLHYYRGREGLNSPFRINDDDRYVRTMKAATGIAAFWSGKLNDQNNAFDHVGPGAINAPINGGVFTAASMCIGHPEYPALRFNGTTGYLSPNDASLHPGNTGSWGMVFRRGSGGSAQTLWSGGTDDITISFDATNHIWVEKEGTGDGFVSNATYTDTTSVYHLVVTHSAGNGFIVYVNGDAIAGTATSRTLSAGANTINIGRRKSSGDQFFQGRIWGAWVSSSEFSAATVAAQFAIWNSIEPEDLVIDRDSSDTTQQVWVKGGQDDKTKSNGSGTGFVSWSGSGDPDQFERVRGPGEGGPRLAQEFIDRPDSDNARKRSKYALSYMAAKAGTTVSATWTMSYDPQYIQKSGIPSTWRPGQTAVITSNDANGLSNYQLEIKQVDVDLLNANGETQFTISAGALPYSYVRKARQVQSRGMA